MGHFERHLHSITGLDPDVILSVLNRYEESHRFYHNVAHVHNVYNYLIKKWENAEWFHLKILGLAALFHDAVYDPRREDNEELSAELFRSSTSFEASITEAVVALILASGNKVNSVTSKKYTKLIEIFLEADQASINSDLPTMIQHSILVSKEYGFVMYKNFVEEHCKVIEKCWTSSRFGRPVWADYLKPILSSRKPSVGIYPGSFNPFHLGHLDVLNKASKLFDYVIVARGLNPKKLSLQAVPDQGIYLTEIAGVPKNFRAISFTTSLAELYSHFKDAEDYGEVTIVRGFRNSSDIEYEQVQHRFVEEMNTGKVPYVYLECDKGLSHVSSSSIRMIESMGYSTDKWVPKNA